VRKLRRGISGLVTIYTLLIIMGALVLFALNTNHLAIEIIKTFTKLGLWLAIPMLLLAVLATEWQSATLALIPVVLFGVVYLPYMPRNPEVPAGQQLSIMTFNMQTNDAELLDLIAAADADIVALQELSIAGAAVLENDLQDEYPYQALHPQTIDYMGQGILSRYPIMNDEYWEYTDVPDTTGHQRVEIDFNGENIVIYNIHPWPPAGYQFEFSDPSHRIPMQRIMERAFAETAPMLIVGDMNMSDEFAEYNMLAARLIDSYMQAGDGLGYTFPNLTLAPLPPMLRLDYIFHTDDFHSIESVILDAGDASDHSVVMSTLIFVENMD
jgi:vancomycin resistance protein VanJ